MTWMVYLLIQNLLQKIAHYLNFLLTIILTVKVPFMWNWKLCNCTIDTNKYFGIQIHISWILKKFQNNGIGKNASPKKDIHV